MLAAYSEDEAAFDARDVRVLAAFARVIADIVARGRLVAADPAGEDPETARVVNQAIGVLITHHCDEDQALRRLTRISESTQQPLGRGGPHDRERGADGGAARLVAHSPRQRLDAR